MKKIGPRLGILGLSFFLFSRVVNSHPLDLGLVQLDIFDSIKSSLDLNPTLVGHLLGVPELNEQILRDHAQTLFNLTLGSGTLQSAGVDCHWGSPSASSFGQTIRVSAEANCGGRLGGDLVLTIPFVHHPKVPRTFQMLIKTNVQGVDQLFTLKGDSDRLNLTVRSQEGLGSFIMMGMRHIGATPGEWGWKNGFHFPEGIDHILFLLALILVGGGFLEMIKTASGFTVGHSITLALASTGVWRLPGRLTESAIALSIAYVALESVFVSNPRRRWLVAALFGLVHGFGFASALTELNLHGRQLVEALVGFNCGVELGQAMIIAVLIPLLLPLEKHPSVERFFVRASASFIFVVGSYWFVQRAFLG